MVGGADMLWDLLIPVPFLEAVSLSAIRHQPISSEPFASSSCISFSIRPCRPFTLEAQAIPWLWGNDGSKRVTERDSVVNSEMQYFGEHTRSRGHYRGPLIITKNGRSCGALALLGERTDCGSLSNGP